MNENFNKALEEIRTTLDTAVFNEKKEIRFDLSDIGNEIGFAIAKHFSDEMGFDKESFMHGIKHGISLIDGTHPKPKEL